MAVAVPGLNHKIAQRSIRSEKRSVYNRTVPAVFFIGVKLIGQLEHRAAESLASRVPGFSINYYRPVLRLNRTIPGQQPIDSQRGLFHNLITLNIDAILPLIQ